METMTPTKRKEIASFKRFLLDNKVYSAYKINVETSDNTFFREYDFCSLSQLLNSRRKEEFISYAFDWSKTIQGHNFWEGIDGKWLRYLRIKYDFS